MRSAVAYFRRAACLAAALVLASLFPSPVAAQITGLACDVELESGSITCSWTNESFHDVILVFEDGVLITELFGNADQYTAPLPTGPVFVEYCFEPLGQPQECCVVDLPPPAPEGVVCTPGSYVDEATGQLLVDWTNPVADYDSISVFACGELVATLAGDATTATVTAAPGTVVPVEVVGERLGLSSDAGRCVARIDELPPGVLSLACVPVGSTVEVSWVNGGSYDEIEILVNGALETLLPGDATAHLVDTSGLGSGSSVEIEVIVGFEGISSGSGCTTIAGLPPGEPVKANVTLWSEAVRVDLDAPPPYVSVDLYRDGVLLAVDVRDQYVDPYSGIDHPHPTYQAAAHLASGETYLSPPVTIFIPAVAGVEFVRGECNGDGSVNLADVLKILIHLFLTTDDAATLQCADACDTNDDAMIDVSDAISLLNYLFAGGVAPALPFPDCGFDPAPSLGCAEASVCPPPTPDWDLGWSHTQSDVLATGDQRPPQPLPTGEAPLIEGLVSPHSGEVLFAPAIPHSVIEGRLQPLDTLPLVYSSQIDFRGCVGRGWNLWPLTERVVQLPGGAVRRFDSQLVRFDDYDDGGDTPGVFDHLDNNCNGEIEYPAGDVVCFRSPDGTRTVHAGFNGEPSDGVLLGIVDRFGNRVLFEHDASGRITRMLDDFGRAIDYAYDARGRLESVTDFTGRETTFTYDEADRLVALTLPAVTDTPNPDDGIDSNGASGNDYPDGKTYNFEYDEQNLDPRLRDNLVAITYPNEVATGGPPRYRLTYGTDEADVSFDRVVGIEPGGATTAVRGNPIPNPPVLGGRILTFEDLEAAPPGGEASTEVRMTTVTDGNGNVVQYGFSGDLHCIRKTVVTARDVNPDDPSEFVTLYTYDDEHRLTSVTHPAGNFESYVYDAANVNRASQGNLLEAIETPDAARGGDQIELRTSYTYEPIYNQVRTVTEPRGNDPDHVPLIADDATIDEIDFNLDGDGSDAADGETVRRRRYTTLTIFDYQEGTAADIEALAEEESIVLPDLDGDGAADAAVALALDTDVNGDGNTGQTAGADIEGRGTVATGSIETIKLTRTFNGFGQIKSEASPEGHLKSYYYHPGDDPDGDGLDLIADADPVTGGYLSVIVRDDDAASAANPASHELRPDGQVIENSGTDRLVSAVPHHTTFDCLVLSPWGSPKRIANGRGVVTEFVRNSHDQVVQVIRAAEVMTSPAADPAEFEPLSSYGYLQFIDYDYNGNVIRVSEESRGDTRSVGANNGMTPLVDHEYGYDLFDRCIEARHEISDAETAVTRYRYDRAGNLVLVVHPEGNATTAVYDDRNLLYRVVTGATVPTGLTQLHPSDPIDFVVGGGIPAASTRSYDANGNLIETSDADDTDGSPDNNGQVGDRTRYVYDGFDRHTSTIDAEGNQEVVQYDPAGNAVRHLAFGRTGGPAPTTDGPDDLPGPVSTLGTIDIANLVNSTLLAGSEAYYDELDRVFRADELLFHNSTPTTRVVDIADGATDVGKGSAVVGDDGPVPGLDAALSIARVNTLYTFDRSSRCVEVVEDDGDVWTYLYDGHDRTVEILHPEGNLRERVYDDNHNLIEERETDVSQVPGVPEELLVTTYVYDALDRLTRTIDNLGQTVHYGYDSLDAVVAAADAEGPAGDVIARRAFTGGAKTVNDSNDPGNVTLYSYDGLGRRVGTEQVLTASGAGSGDLGVDEDGVPTGTLTPDVLQGGGDGIVRRGTVYDTNSNVVAVIDDQGNVSAYLYDDHDRCVVEIEGLEIGGALPAIPPIPTPTEKTLFDPLSIPTPVAEARLLTIDAYVSLRADDFSSLSDRQDPATLRVRGLDPDGHERISVDEKGTTATSTVSVWGGTVFCAYGSTFGTGGGGAGGTVRVNVERDGLQREVCYIDEDDDNDTVDSAWSYDSLGRVVEESLTINGDVWSTSSSWRGEALRSRVIYPGGREFLYEHDGLDRIVTMTEATEAEPFVVREHFGPTRAVRRTYPETGIVASYLDETGVDLTGYDGVRRPIALRHETGAGTAFLGFARSYDRRSYALTEDMTHDPANNAISSYDSRGGLLTFDRPDPEGQLPIHTSWSLDGIGNWSQVNGETREHSNFNELITRSDDMGNLVESTHDDNGNLTSDGSRTYSYDALDRLIRVEESDGFVEEYRYDALSRRVLRTRSHATDISVPVTTVLYLRDGDRTVEERDEGGALLVGHVYEFGPSGTFARPCYSFDELGERRYYHEDFDGSPRAVTDATGGLLEAYQYDAHGHPVVITDGGDGALDFGIDDLYTSGGESLIGNPFGFGGARRDAETGLYLTGGRYFDTDRGRSLQRGGKVTLLKRNGYTGTPQGGYVCESGGWQRTAAAHRGKVTLLKRGGRASVSSDDDVCMDFLLWNAHKFSASAWRGGKVTLLKRSEHSASGGMVDLSDFNLWNAHKIHTSAWRGGKVTLLKRGGHAPVLGMEGRRVQRLRRQSLKKRWSSGSLSPRRGKVTLLKRNSVELCPDLSPWKSSSGVEGGGSGAGGDSLFAIIRRGKCKLRRTVGYRVAGAFESGSGSGSGSGGDSLSAFIRRGKCKKRAVVPDPRMRSGAVTGALKKGDRVSLVGFGTWSRRTMPSGLGGAGSVAIGGFIPGRIAITEEGIPAGDNGLPSTFKGTSGSSK